MVFPASGCHTFSKPHACYFSKPFLLIMNFFKTPYQLARFLHFIHSPFSIPNSPLFIYDPGVFAAAALRRIYYQRAFAQRHTR